MNYGFVSDRRTREAERDKSLHMPGDVKLLLIMLFKWRNKAVNIDITNYQSEMRLWT
jgi:hypothetical protein